MRRQEFHGGGRRNVSYYKLFFEISIAQKGKKKGQNNLQMHPIRGKLS